MRPGGVGSWGRFIPTAATGVQLPPTSVAGIGGDAANHYAFIGLPAKNEEIWDFDASWANGAPEMTYTPWEYLAIWAGTSDTYVVGTVAWISHRGPDGIWRNETPDPSLGFDLPLTSVWGSGSDVYAVGADFVFHRAP
jgi:hypothetical protein